MSGQAATFISTGLTALITADTAAVVRDRGVIDAGQSGDRVGAAAAIMMGL